MMWRLCVGLLVLLFSAAALDAQETADEPREGAGATAESTTSGETDQSATAAEQYKKLIGQFNQARTDFFQLYRTAKTDEEKKKLAQEYPRPEQYADQILELAQENLQDPFAVDALIWIVTNATYGEASNKAIDLLLENFVDSDKLGPACTRLAYVGTPAATRLMETVLEKNPHREVKAQACFALGNAAMRRGSETPDEAEKLFQRLIDEFGDVKSYRGTMGELAERYLFEIRNLAIGKVAPEIEGEDIDGEFFKLSDYRGKVVVLDFWGDW